MAEEIHISTYAICDGKMLSGNVFSGLRVHATCRSDQSAENVGLKLATDMKNSSENSFGINSVGMYVYAFIVIN